MLKSPQYYDLIDQFPHTGCAVCQLVLRDVDRYIDALLYEYINKPFAHDAFRASRGLCNTHGARMLHSQGNALGVAVLCHSAFDEVIHIEARTGPGSKRPRMLRKTGDSLSDALQPVGPCQACDFMDGSEDRFLQVIVDFMQDERFFQAFEKSGGLCLPHARMVLRMFRKTQDRSIFLQVQQKKWAALQAELQEFMRKYDVNNAGEVMTEEGDSWQRATRYLMGENGVFGLRRTGERT